MSMRAEHLKEANEIVAGLEKIANQRLNGVARIILQDGNSRNVGDLRASEAFAEMVKAWERHLGRREGELRRRAAQIGLVLS